MGTSSATALESARKTRTSSDASGTRWWQSTLVLALVGMVLFWAALPPLEWAPLAWFAPVSWVVLIRRHQLAGRRPYGALWLASFVFYLVTFYWVTFPHPATSIGWLLLSAYLGVYFPAFVGLSRVAVHRLRVSPILAAPIVWTGLELLRGHLFTGFGMAALAHTQYRWPSVLQIADTFGGYGVSFVIVFVGACLACLLPLESNGGGQKHWRLWPLVPGAVVLAAVLGYGYFRLHQQITTPGPTIALIQGSIDIEMKHDPNEARTIFDQYYGISRKAVWEHPDLDLIVWPETMFRDSWLVFDPQFKPPADSQWTVEEVEKASRQAVAGTVRSLGVPFLLGIDSVHYAPDSIQRYNTALFTDAEGKPTARYDKCHLVPFGEYVWLADWFPWLYRLTPLPFGSTPGDGPHIGTVKGARIAPNICYENTIPHLIRGHVSELRARNEEPDLLVNLTNDGWFFGSTELDLHLACAVFRAIECRKPFLIAANTGFSASIDADGVIQSQARRRETDLIVVATQLDSRQSTYLTLGDLPAWGCLVLTIGLALVGLAGRRSAQPLQPATPSAAETA